MFHHAYLEQLGNNKLRHEEKLVLEDCQRHGLETTLYHAKQIQRRQLPLDTTSFICGDMDAMHGAMKQLGIEPPVPNDFPDSLEPFFHRRVWRSSLASLDSALDDGQEIFAKPAGRRKLFTGRVFSSPDDMYGLSRISRQEPLWCSDVVEWHSEYRVYVIEGSIVSIDFYAGDAAVPLDETVVREALDAHAASGTAPAAYGIDFGVLSTGETALVEANDGYALGAYQIDSASYARLLQTRWAQLSACLKDRIMEAAKKHLADQGISHGDMVRCDEPGTSKSGGHKKTWVVEFESQGAEKIGNDHVVVLVNTQTLKADGCPSL